MTPRILMLGAGSNPANNMARSLRRTMPAAYLVGADTNRYTLDASDCHRCVQLVTTPADGAAHRVELERIMAENDLAMVWAQPEQEVEFLARHGSFRWFGPSYPLVQACQDKLKTAERLGDMAPASVWYPAWLVAAAGEEDAEPVWMRARKGAGSLAAKAVRGVDDAVAWARVWEGRVGLEEFMVAEVLPGRDLSYTSVWHEGRVVIEAARERVEYLDTRTPSGQCSTPRVARTHLDPAFYEFCQAAVRRICGAEQPHGVFYLDTREDAQGEPRVTEVNAGRFNTTSDFYAAAGCDVYQAAVWCALGDPPPYSRLEGDWFWVRMMDQSPLLVAASRYEQEVAA